MSAGGLPVRSPDTIPDLAPDCRRVLRDEYLVVQARMLRPRQGGPKSDREKILDAALGDEDSYAGSVAEAIAEYRRVARLWGVDVEDR